MPKLNYHPVYAWNLVADLIQSKEIPERQTGGYIQFKLDIGRRSGWLNNENAQVAREMLVFSDGILLPGEVDAPIPTYLRNAGHINYWSEGDPSLREDRWRMKIQEYRHAELRLLMPMLIDTQGPEETVTESELDRLFDYWKDCEKWEEDNKSKYNEDTWNMIEVMRTSSLLRDQFLEGVNPRGRKRLLSLLESDPKRHNEEFAKLADRIRPLTSLVSEAYILGAHGIPTLFRNKLAPRTLNVEKIPIDFAEQSAAVVGLYFENILVPRPENLREALRFKESKEISAWRTKMAEWTNLLHASKVGKRDIIRGIEDANNYIDIALPKSKVGVLGRLESGYAGPLAELAAHLVGFGIVLPILKLWRKVVTDSIRSPDRLQYRWVMLSASGPSTAPKG